MKNELRDDRLFMANVVDRIEGWLDRFAALRTIDLLRFQELRGIGGPVYEVGLYHGKYFALLVRSAACTGERAIGIDSFAYVAREQFEREFADRASLGDMGTLDFRLLAGASREWDAGELLEVLGAPARFISVDGSHEHDDVLWDLRIAGSLLAEAGVIAADDYLNPTCLGVNEAINRFLIATAEVVPFAYIANKLFLCRPAWANLYRGELERCIMADRAEPKSAFYRAQVAADGRHNVEPILFGRPVLSIPL